jgi:hypothetical protein
LLIRLARGSAFTRAIVMWRDLHQRLARIEASQVEHAPVPGIKPMKLGQDGAMRDLARPQG